MALWPPVRKWATSDRDERAVSRLAEIAAQSPKRVIALWLAVVLVLSVIGLDVGEKLLPTQLNVPGTSQYRAFQLSGSHFPDQEAAVLLQGPKPTLEAQGAALTRALALRPNTVAVSPWSEGAGASAKTLRPKPDQALIVIGLRVPKGQTAASIVPPFERFVRRRVSSPVKASLSGTAVIQADLNEALVHSIEHAELLSYPILVVVLLLVFGSPVAAAIPLVMGAGTVYAGFGVLDILASHLQIDAVACNMCSMVGLAVGVDYSLLIVTRFREALEEGKGVSGAARLSGGTAGGTVLFAGSTLLAIMLVTILLSPGSALLSGALGAIIVTALSVASAALVTPAFMRLLGHRVNALQIFRARKRRPGSSRKHAHPIGALVRRLSRRPALAAAAVLLLLTTLASPLLAIQTIPPDPRTLPAANRGLLDFDRVKAAGFGPAISIVIASSNGSLTSTSDLGEIASFERKLARLRYAKSVIGPAVFQSTADRLAGSQRHIGVAARQLKQGAEKLSQLQAGLLKAGGGVRTLRAGLAKASTGATQLSAATSQRAFPGSERLRSGAERAGSGAERLATGEMQAESGSRRIAAGASRLSDGLTGRLSPGAQRLASGLREGEGKLTLLRLPAKVTQLALEKAWCALTQMTTGKGDPRYVETLTAVGTALAAISGKSPLGGPPPVRQYEGMDASLALAAAQAGRAANGAQQIAAGARRAAAGGKRLSAGALRLRSGLQSIYSGTTKLRAGLQRLGAGAGRLLSGLIQIGAGQRALASKLFSGVSRTAPLQSRLLAAARAVAAAHAKLLAPGGAFDELHSVQELQARSPRFFSSGYLTLAALQGSPPFAEATSRYLLDSTAGGGLARVVVLPSVPPNDPRTAEIVEATVREARAFAHSSGLTVAVGGAATQLVDYKQVVDSRMPLLVISIALVTFLFLVIILRSLLLPAIAVALNLLTVGSGFGVLTLLFTGSHPVLGTSGALDVVSVGGIFAITFALSIDYQVFLLTRMREELVRTGSSVEAIHAGIDSTGKVVTGAAAIMVAVFLAFALSSFVSVSQFGIGLACAVLIDATIVRLVLLPNLMLLGGRWIWWLPSGLDRRLPHLEVA